mmetsp:Transcript_51607/g.116169  ORF Transcript_51607/g.116169 Transcript_51607/m.116169 type:complete len:497 (-) Transcript_51607:460-1950(-)
MHDLRDLVHKCHDAILEHLCRDAEVTDPGGTNNALNPGAFDHCVDVCTIEDLHVVGDDVCTSLPKAESQQRTKLDDGLLENHCLHEFAGGRCWRAHHNVPKPLELVLLLPLRLCFVHLLKLKLVVGHLHCHQWIFAEGVHLGDHVLDWMQHEPVCVVREEERHCHQRQADEQRSPEGEHALLLDKWAEVKVEGKVPRLVRGRVYVQPWSVLFPLGPAKALRAGHGIAHGVLYLVLQQGYAKAELLFLGVVGALSCPRLAQRCLNLLRHAPVVVEPRRRFTRKDLQIVVDKILHRGGLYGCFGGLAQHGLLFVADYAKPEHVGEVRLRARCAQWTFLDLCVEPVVIIQHVQQVVFVDLPVAMGTAMLLHLGERLVDLVRPIGCRRWELVHRVYIQVWEGKHHQQHQTDHPARRHLGKLLSDPALSLQLQHAHVDIVFVPVITIAPTGIGFPFVDPLPCLSCCQDRLVKLQDAHESDDSRHAPGSCANLCCPRPPHIV